LFVHHPDHAKIIQLIVNHICKNQNEILQNIHQLLPQNLKFLVPSSEQTSPLRFFHVEPKHIVGFTGNETISQYLARHLGSLVAHPLESHGKAMWDFNRIEQDWISNIFVGKPYLASINKDMEFRFSLTEEVLTKTKLDRVIPQVLLFPVEMDKSIDKYYLYYSIDELGTLVKMIKSVGSLVICIGGDATTSLNEFIKSVMKENIWMGQIPSCINLEHLFAFQEKFEEKIGTDKYSLVPGDFKVPLEQHSIELLQIHIARATKSTVEDMVTALKTFLTDIIHDVPPDAHLVHYLKEIPPLDEKDEVDLPLVVHNKHAYATLQFLLQTSKYRNK